MAKRGEMKGLKNLKIWINFIYSLEIEELESILRSNSMPDETRKEINTILDEKIKLLLAPIIGFFTYYKLYNLLRRLEQKWNKNE